MKITLHLLFLLTTTSLFSQTTTKTEYFRHLRYNHVSPYIPITGIHPISQEEAESTSHYIFNFNNNGQIIEIINNHYHTEKKHPLAYIGVYKLRVVNLPGQEIRTFYDCNGKRVSNDRDVYKEIYTIDQNQFRTGLTFYDLNDKKIESNWKIAEYQWTLRNDFIIERRFDLEKELANVSPYFDYGITGILVDKNGVPEGHYNLNDQLEVSNNSAGIASYKDTYDQDGNHVKYSYYNENDSLTLNPWKFAIGKKLYDEIGNNILLEQYDVNGKLIRSRPVYSNASIEISKPLSAQDSIDIIKQSLGYLQALQQMDPVLMKEVMNDSLNKVTIGYNRELKKEIAKPTTRDQMIAFAENWNKSNTKFPPVPTNNITILSTYNRIASVQLVSDNWVEYLHLIKLDGKWEIVNLIWQHKDVNRYPK